MLRYLALATIIVLVILIVVTGIRGGFSGSGGRDRYATAARSAEPERLPRSSETAAPVKGSAPWALTSLPECFTQTLRIQGPRAYLNARTSLARGRRGAPHGLVEIPVGSELRSADCTVLRRRTGELDVRRGRDVALTVPAVVAFQTDAPLSRAPRVRTLVLLVGGGDIFVLRRYRTPADAVISGGGL